MHEFSTAVLVFAFMVVLFAYPVNAQVQQEETKDIVDQADVRLFLELGEEKYREECNKDIPDNEVLDYTMNDLLDYMPDDFREDICEGIISEIKNQTLGSIIEEK